MAKKNKERIILENVELKPQVIGYTYQKKSNIGRVIFIFIIFALAVFYINDISTFINDLLGKNTAPSIKENTESNKPNNSNLKRLLRKSFICNSPFSETKKSHVLRHGSFSYQAIP